MTVSIEHPTRSRWAVMTTTFLVCTSVGLFFATRLYLIRSQLDQRPITWTTAIRSSLATWYLWAATAWLVVRLARRFPIERDRWRVRVLIHVPASLVMALLHLALCAVWYWFVEAPAGDPRTWWVMYKVQLLISFHWDVLIYAGVLAVTHAFDYDRRSREGELRASQLETQLAHAQLGALKMQLHPHFLFNSLNAVAALVHDDPAAAEQTIVRLGELLRFAMENANVLEVPLGDELDFARKYLAIERIRYGDRLSVHWEIDPQLLSAMVPSLILQPLVENAVRHGAAGRCDPCGITVAAGRHNGALRLEVRDTGSGPMRNDMSASRRGVGLSNTRARLQQMYGFSARLDLLRPADGGWIARVEMPLRAAASLPPGSGGFQA
jgi:signal transduction histidine kinase